MASSPAPHGQSLEDPFERALCLLRTTHLAALERVLAQQAAPDRACGERGASARLREPRKDEVLQGYVCSIPEHSPTEGLPLTDSLTLQAQSSTATDARLTFGPRGTGTACPGGTDSTSRLGSVADSSPGRLDSMVSFALPPKESQSEPQGDAVCSDDPLVGGGSAKSKTTKRKLSFSQHAKTMPRVEKGRLELLVTSNSFDSFFSFLIFLNVLVMVAEAQFGGMHMGAVVEYRYYALPELPPNPQNYPLWKTLETTFGVIFTIELALKIGGQRCSFFADLWNWMDGLIVLAWFLTVLEADGIPYLQPFMLRLVRLVRLLRLVRLVRTMKAFDSLVIMSQAIKGSLSILFWTAVVLTLVLMLCALAIQASVEYFLEDTDDKFAQHEVFMYYGTFFRALLSMFEITLGNWMPPCRALVENVSEWFMLFFVFHKLIVGFSVLAVINGVFMQETFKVANHDDHLMLLEKERQIRTHTEKMKRLFEHLDEDHSEEVTRDEFRQVCSDAIIRKWLSAMELDVADVDCVFGLLDETGSGNLTVEQLVTGMNRLKGHARAIDVLSLTKEVHRHGLALREIMKIMKSMSEAKHHAYSRWSLSM